MTARGLTSSQAYATSVYEPNYAPPVPPGINYIYSRTPMISQLNVQPSTNRTGSAVVSSKFRRNGMRYLFSMGATTKRWFSMIATGQVESTKFQRQTATTYDTSFNDALFAAGYPQNLGLSFKVQNTASAAGGQNPYAMLPRPQYRRTVYTRRPFTIAPSLVAKPQAT